MFKKKEKLWEMENRMNMFKTAKQVAKRNIRPKSIENPLNCYYISFEGLIFHNYPNIQLLSNFATKKEIANETRARLKNDRRRK